jgi:tetratricopeptide (TPR) repeat protein
LTIHREHNNLEGEANTLNNLAALLRVTEEWEKGTTYLLQALAINEQIGDVHSQATTLNNLGSFASLNGDLIRAVSYYAAALHIRRQIEDNEGAAKTLYNLAQVWIKLSDLPQAESFLKEAVHLDETYSFVNLLRDRHSLRKVQAALARKRNHQRSEPSTSQVEPTPLSGKSTKALNKD